jgi:hypothetical protein
VRLIAPVRWLVRHVSDRITTWIVGPHRASEHILQIDEFRSVIEDVAQTGKLTGTARTLINNLLSAGATEIVEIMTPRSRTVFLDAELGVPRLVEEFREARHSRVPVYRQHRDNLVGFLHSEDACHSSDADRDHARFLAAVFTTGTRLLGNAVGSSVQAFFSGVERLPQFFDVAYLDLLDVRFVVGDNANLRRQRIFFDDERSGNGTDLGMTLAEHRLFVCFLFDASQPRAAEHAQCKTNDHGSEEKRRAWHRNTDKQQLRFHRLSVL